MECSECAYLRRASERAGIRTEGCKPTCERCYDQKIAYICNLTPKQEEKWKQTK